MGRGAGPAGGFDATGFSIPRLRVPTRIAPTIPQTQTRQSFQKSKTSTACGIEDPEASVTNICRASSRRRARVPEWRRGLSDSDAHGETSGGAWHRAGGWMRRKNPKSDKRSLHLSMPHDTLGEAMLHTAKGISSGISSNWLTKSHQLRLIGDDPKN